MPINTADAGWNGEINGRKASSGLYVYVAEIEMEDGEIREVAMHDGSTVILKNLEKGYDPTNRYEALRVMEEAQRNNWLVTGLLYVNTTKPNLTSIYNLVDTPLNRLTEAELRPERSMIDKINSLMF
ncbi:MAG: hypothetical protein JNM02_07855 [Anaerolineales bacterium]|nr:hypothetical protein [Anaerolineales bacterium]